jgi:hypothetical protein
VAKSELAGQVRAFVNWVGTGRKLTQTGRITLADARRLVEELGTDDEIDPTIGDRVFRTTSSQELPHLTLVVEWAKSARLVRKTSVRGQRAQSGHNLVISDLIIKALPADHHVDGGQGEGHDVVAMFTPRLASGVVRRIRHGPSPQQGPHPITTRLVEHGPPHARQIAHPASPPRHADFSP